MKRKSGKSENLMGTAEVYRATAERGGYMKKAMREALDLFSAVVTEALASGRTVRYAPLGTFKPVRRKRRGREERYVTVLFRPAPAVLRQLNRKEAEGDAGGS